MTFVSDLQMLEANLARLPERDRPFARSLCEKAARARMGGWQLSPKQLYWIGELARRASTPAGSPQESETAGLGAAHAFMLAASQRFANARVRLAIGEGPEGANVRLSVARQGRFPGSVNITADERYSPERAWYGRLSEDGVFRPSRTSLPGLAAALQAFAADPARVARVYGQRTGNCCFCGRVLTDAPSLFAGYGPICAEHFNLPWGDTGGLQGGFRQQEAAAVVAPAPRAPRQPGATGAADPLDDESFLEDFAR